MNFPAQQASGYHLQPNTDRIIESVLFLVQEAERRGISITQYDVVKSIFLADKAHLNKYGRPITFDNYVAMKHGPVPSLTYDFLKENQTAIRRHSIDLPWDRRAAPEFGKGCYIYSHPHRAPDMEVLSESDLEELRNALTVVKALGFVQIKRLTHGDQAYMAAWRDEGTRSQYPMNYSLLFETPNEKKAEEISFLSKHV
jgi:hypothetical protein